MRAAIGRDHNGLTNDKSFFGSGLKAKTETKNTFLLFIIVQRSSQEKCCQSVAVLWKNSIFRKKSQDFSCTENLKNVLDVYVW